MTPFPPFLPPRQCTFCHQPLTAHQAARGGTCDLHGCRHQAAVRNIAARKAVAEARLLANAATHRDQVAANLRIANPRELPIAIVPASRSRLKVLPPWRKRLFREHLEGILTRLAQTPVSSRAPLPPEERPDAAQFHAEPPVFGAGCATCRGYCCSAGGVKAFIDQQTLQRFAAANPSLDSKKTVRAYVRHLPKRGIENSCVFHGEQGCALPREMRSAICNNYHCEDLRKLHRIDARRVLITAAAEADVVRSAVFADERIIATFQPGTAARTVAI